MHTVCLLATLLLLCCGVNGDGYAIEARTSGANWLLERGSSPAERVVPVVSRRSFVHTLASPSPSPTSQTVFYSEFGAEIPNPERGFLHFPGDCFQTFTLSDLQDYRRVENITVIMCHFYVNALLGVALDSITYNQIDGQFNMFRDAGLKTVLRFSYTQNTDTTNFPDAPLSDITSHLNTMAPLLAAHYDVILCFQAGFIGAYGEWYYTQYFGDQGVISPSEYADRKTVTDLMLASLPADRQIQLRTPLFKQTLYGSSALTSGEAFSGSDRARVGHFNDAFVASPDDFGTFVDAVNEYPYLATETLYVIMGGENDDYNPPRSDCSTAMSEMALFHYTFFNADYYTVTLDAWKSQGCYADMQKQLGYRFVLNSATLPLTAETGATVALSFSITNKGFAPCVNPRNVEFVLRAGVVVYSFALSGTNTDPRYWVPGAAIPISASVALSGVTPGVYSLYLHLADPVAALHDRPEYAIQLANVGTWSDTDGFNSLLATMLVTPPSSSPSPSESVSLSPSVTLTPTTSPTSSVSPSPGGAPSSSTSPSISSSPSLSSSLSTSPSISSSPSSSPASPTPSSTSSLSASSTPSNSESSTPSPTISDTPSTSPTISDSPSVSPTTSLSPSVTSSNSESPSASPSFGSSPSASPSSSVSQSTSLSPTVSLSTSVSATVSVSSSVSPSKGGSPTSSSSASASLLVGSSSSGSPSLSSSRSPTISQSSSFGASQSRTPSISATASTSVTRTPSKTRTVTASPTATSTTSTSETKSATPTTSSTNTATASSTRTATRTASRSKSLSASTTNTRSAGASLSSTSSESRTPTTSKSESRSPTKSVSPTKTSTASRSDTPSSTNTRTCSRTSSPTSSATGSSTTTITPTSSLTPSPTASITRTGTVSATETRTTTRTPSPSRTSGATGATSPSTTNTATASETSTASISRSASMTPSRSAVSLLDIQAQQAAVQAAADTAEATRVRNEWVAIGVGCGGGLLCLILCFWLMWLLLRRRRREKRKREAKENLSYTSSATFDDSGVDTAPLAGTGFGAPGGRGNLSNVSTTSLPLLAPPGGSATAQSEFSTESARKGPSPVKRLREQRIQRIEKTTPGYRPPQSVPPNPPPQPTARNVAQPAGGSNGLSCSEFSESGTSAATALADDAAFRPAVGPGAITVEDWDDLQF